MQEGRDDRSLGELFTELTNQVATLVRQEVELARTEMTAKATRAGRDVALVVAGGAIAYGGFLALLGAVGYLLFTIGLPIWLSFLLVGVAAAAAGYVLIQRGRQALQVQALTPDRTIRTLKEDAEWAKDQTK